MSNVIRPTFGRPRPDPAEQPAAADPEGRPVRVLGDAAGYIVGIMRDEAPEGRILRVVIGSADGNEIETVGQVPDTPETEMDAEAMAYAVLRALEIVEGADEPGGGEAG